jgi:hypothetical protein
VAFGAGSVVIAGSGASRDARLNGAVENRRSAEPVNEVEIDSGERRADLMHRAPDGERSEIDSREAGAVDQLDDHPLRFLIVAGGEDDGAGFFL